MGSDSGIHVVAFFPQPGLHFGMSCKLEKSPAESSARGLVSGYQECPE